MYASWFITIALTCKWHRPKEAIVQLACTMVSLWILSTCLLTSRSLRKYWKSEWLKKGVSCCSKKTAAKHRRITVSFKKVFSFIVLLCIRLFPVPRFNRERLCLTTRVSLASVWAAWLIALSCKAARYIYKSLGNQNSASWYVDKIMCTLQWR